MKTILAILAFVLTIGLISPAACAAAAEKPARAADKIKFKSNDKDQAFSLKPKDNGLKLVDASENELARINIESLTKLKIKDGSDKTLGFVTGQSPKWQLKNPGQDKVLFQLIRDPKGDLLLQDPDDKLLFRIAKKQTGADVLSPDNKTLFTARLKDGKLTLRNDTDKALLATTDTVDPQAASLFAIGSLTLPQRAALWFIIDRPAEVEGK